MPSHNTHTIHTSDVIRTLQICFPKILFNRNSWGDNYSLWSLAMLQVCVWKHNSLISLSAAFDGPLSFHSCVCGRRHCCSHVCQGNAGAVKCWWYHRHTGFPSQSAFTLHSRAILIGWTVEPELSGLTLIETDSFLNNQSFWQMVI